MKNRIKDRGIAVLVIILAVILLLSIFLWFRWKMNDEITNTVTTYLSKNVSSLSAVFRTKLEDQIVMLESQARFFKNVDFTDYNQVKNTILSTKGAGSFRSIGVAFSSGATLNYNGKSAGNILLQDYFQEAMQGKNSISEHPITDEHGDEVLAMAVPVKQNGLVVGTIYGTFTSSEIRNLINLVRFHELGANILLTSDGSILSTNAAIQVIGRDVKNMNELLPDFAIDPNADYQYYNYSVNGSDYLIVLTSAGVHNWYFATILPSTVMTEQLNTFSGYLVFTIAAIAAVFILLTVFIIFSGRHNERVRKELGDKASKDSLTQLLNKRFYEQEIKHAIAAAGKDDYLIMCMIDIDDFKHINDCLGHAVGDMILTETAARIGKIFRKNDLVGRVGGDEFSVFIRCKKSDVADREKLVHERGKAIVREMSKPFVYSGGETSVSMSVGFSYWPEHGTDYKTLYEKADSALYKAKRGGKNRYEIYE